MDDRRLYSPAYVNEILNKHGFKFTKSLGQNFLIDGNIVRAIVSNSNIDGNDYVLEVGPGIGTLTEELARNSKKVLAVEIDESLKPILNETLYGHENVEIYYGDILKVDLEKLIDEKLGGGPIKVVANLPYYITTPIIGRFLEDDLNIDSLTVMVQKEVADRMVSPAGTKDYSTLSVFINYYTEPEIILEVPKTVFMPQPRVDSAVVKMDIKKNLKEVEREKFFKVVKSGFSMRRKTLLNCLSSGEFEMDKKEIRKMLEDIEIDPRIRAEKLEIEEFIKITENIK